VEDLVIMLTRWILLLVMGLGVAGCATNPSTGRRQFILLSSDQVAAMGEEAKPEVIKEYGGEVASPELRQYIDRVGRSLAAHTEPAYAKVRWEFTVLNSDVINAFALPGGKIFISRGLLELFDDEAQVAGVLGHEIGHVTARHMDEQLSRNIALQFGLDATGAMTDSELLNAGAGVLVNVTVLKFSRDQESEADSQGLKYMTATGYDPDGMLEVMRVLKEASRGNEQWEMLATHPLPETRIQRITKLLETKYQPMRNNPAYGKYRERFQSQAVPYMHGSRARILEHDDQLSWCAVCDNPCPVSGPREEIRLVLEPIQRPPAAAAGPERIGALR
jgi:predicted Zn-dependent protease